MFIQDKAVTTDILQLVFNFLNCRRGYLYWCKYLQTWPERAANVHRPPNLLIDSTVTRKEPLIITEDCKALPKTKVQIFLLIV